MRGNLTVFVSGLLVLGIMLPLVLTYLLLLTFFVGVVNPLGHAYRIARYGIQTEPLELV